MYLVQRIIDYGCGQPLLMNVHKIMKRYAHIILNVKQQVSTVTLFCNLGWLPVDVHIWYFTAIVMYNIIHELTLTYLTDVFILNTSVHDHHTAAAQISMLENTACLKGSIHLHIEEGNCGTLS